MKPDEWLAKLSITVTLKDGQKITPAEIAKLVTAPEDVTKIQKKIRGKARGTVRYRDTTTDQKNKPHAYDADTATAICKALNLPVESNYDDGP